MLQQSAKLFEPGSIGMIQLKNRLVMCPMSTGYPNPDGTVNQRTVDYYEKRAQGGVGLVIVEGAIVEPKLGNIGTYPRLFIEDDRYIPGLRTLVESIHRHGAKACLQLQHSGLWAICPGCQPVSPSAMPGRDGVMSHALTIDEIHDLVRMYGESVRRSKEAGFDAVTINGGAGLLLANFLSPLTNLRTDEYGGDFEGRLRFVREIIECVRQKAGKDFTIIFDHPADEFAPGGIDIELGQRIAVSLEAAGVDAFRIHTGIHDPRYMHYIIPPAPVPPAFQVPAAAATKKVLRHAKVMVGRLLDELSYANQVIEKGQADFIILGRPLIADPELPRKAAQGRLEDIRRCLHCNKCMYRPDPTGWAIACTVNPAAGRERDFRMVPAKEIRKVMVVGGGPAGMEAALIAANRGHKVTLFERDATLGGQLNIANIPPFKNELDKMTAYYAYQLQKAGVRLETGSEVSKEKVLQEAPDVLILAMGSQPRIPPIEGSHNPNTVLARDALTGKAKTGESVIVVGGGYVGCETAEFLARQGKSVMIIEELPELVGDLERISRTLLLDRISKLGVRTLTDAKVKQVTPDGVLVWHKGSKESRYKADTIIFAVGANPDIAARGLQMSEGPETHVIGDSSAPRNIRDAVYEGAVIARQI